MPQRLFLLILALMLGGAVQMNAQSDSIDLSNPPYILRIQAFNPGLIGEFKLGTNATLRVGADLFPALISDSSLLGSFAFRPRFLAEIRSYFSIDNRKKEGFCTTNYSGFYTSSLFYAGSRTQVSAAWQDLGFGLGYQRAFLRSRAYVDFGVKLIFRHTNYFSNAGTELEESYRIYPPFYFCIGYSIF